MENKNSNTVTKMFVCVAVVYVTCLILSNLVAGKLWALGSITLPAAVVLFPITYIFGDIFTEVYGFKNAKMIIWLGFGCSFFAVMIYLITIALPHPDFWQNQEAYEIVLGTTPRVFIASLTGYLFGEFSNSMILSKMKVAMKGKKLWARTIASTIVGEAFDAAIFVTISFYGTMETAELLKMILFQYLFKVIYEVVFTPVTYAVVKYLKKTEGIDVYDEDVKYRPI